MMGHHRLLIYLSKKKNGEQFLNQIYNSQVEFLCYMEKANKLENDLVIHNYSPNSRITSSTIIIHIIIIYTIVLLY